MPSIENIPTMNQEMLFDDVAWEEGEDLCESWVRQFFNTDLLESIVLRRRFFNLCIRAKYKDDTSVMMRFAQPGVTMFPKEKTRNEIAIMRYIRDQTSISLPFILYWGEEGPMEIGLFMIVGYMDHETTLAQALGEPNHPMEKPLFLDPRIDEEKLEVGYGQMAAVLLELFRLQQPRIGSLSQIDDSTWVVDKRPLSMNLNELVRVGSMPQSEVLSLDATFDTSAAYFDALAELHIKHLANQRNDAVDSETGCRRKFIARQLFWKLAREDKLRTKSLENRPFSIWCDDFRPTNVLVNKDNQMVGTLDWEFSFAAPAEFTHAAPSWLLLQRPESWKEGFEDWVTVFDRRLKTFLTAMIKRENSEIEKGTMKEEDRLSDPMQDSRESGDFWIWYAARETFAFDAIYWKKIDPRFFGATESPENAWKERVDLLDEEQKEEMEKLVALKMDQMKDRVLSWDPDERTLSWKEKRTQAAKAEKATEAVEETEKELEAVETELKEVTLEAAKTDREVADSLLDGSKDV